MSDSNIWRSLTRIITHAAILLAGLWAIDSIGHIFVPHSIAYWIGLCTFVLLATFWQDLIPQRAPAPPETRRTRFFRLFYQAMLLVLALIVLDRVVDHVFALSNGLIFWVSFVLVLGLLVKWRDLVMTRIGLEFLSSAFLERFTLAFGSLVIMLVSLELFVRSEFSRFHVFGIWPTWEILSDTSIRFTLNSAGYRDVEHDAEKQPSVTRVLLIGDSVTAGYGVSQADYYPARLREMAGSQIEFIVAAQPAAETVHEISFLRDYGCEFHPDVVVVGVFSNDPYQGLEKNTPPWPPWRDYFKKLESPYSFNPDLIYMLDSMINRTAGRLGQYNYDQWLDALYDPGQPWIDQWKPIVRQLGTLATECGARRLYAFTLPEPADYSNPDILKKFERMHAVLTEGFTQAGFDTTNLLPAYLERFGERPFRALWAVPNDPHPDAEIHRWYAEQIWAKIGPELQNGR